jgi:hypothetical protein
MRLWLPAAALLLSSVAGATIVVPMTLEEMAIEASCVARGRVVNTQSAWDDAQRRIYTYTEIQILERIHTSRSVPDFVVVRTLGGEVGEVGMKVSGTPRFTLGEEVVVFLRADPVDAEQFQVIGMSQGKLHVERPLKGGELAVWSLEGLAFARPGGDGRMKIDPTQGDPSRIPLDDLRARVLAAVTPAAAAQPGVDVAPEAPLTPRTTTR